MKRLAVFAHFDKNNIIEDYVVYYVNQLKKYCEKVLFLSLSDLPKEEQQKLEDVILVKHNEYDFGSYKRGFNYAKDTGMLEDIDEILFVNDSVYCVNSLDKIFENEPSSDFWGIVENKYGFKKCGKFCFSKKSPHLQSWFLAFRKNVFESEIFKNFLNSVKEEKCKNDVILNYEIKFTQTLVKRGFKYKAILEIFKNSYNPSIYYWREILKENIPFIKRSVLLVLNKDKTTIVDFVKEITNKEALYFIQKNTENVKINKFAPKSVKLIMFNFLRVCPDVLRRVLTKILKTFFAFLFD